MKKKFTILSMSTLLLLSCDSNSDHAITKGVFASEKSQGTYSIKNKYDELKALDNRVKFEEVPATNVLSLNLSGNYQKHREAYATLISYASKNYRTTGPVLGIYPQDPDLVSEAILTWEISIRVLQGKPDTTQLLTGETDPFTIPASKEELGAPLKSFKKPAKPFVLKQLPPVSAVTLVSDVAHLGKDGLLINAWITMNNYVMTATTRTEFGSTKDKSKPIPVKIIVPVKKRTKETL